MTENGSPSSFNTALDDLTADDTLSNETPRDRRTRLNVGGLDVGDRVVVGQFTVRSDHGRVYKVVELADRVRGNRDQLEELGVGNRVFEYRTWEGHAVTRSGLETFSVEDGGPVTCRRVEDTDAADEAAPDWIAEAARRPARRRRFRPARTKAPVTGPAAAPERRPPPVLRDGWLSQEEFSTIEHLITDRQALRELGLSRIEILAVTPREVKVQLVEHSGPKPPVV